MKAGTGGKGTVKQVNSASQNKIHTTELLFQGWQFLTSVKWQLASWKKSWNRKKKVLRIENAFQTGPQGYTSINVLNRGVKHKGSESA